jgi:hypothetical protein
LNVCQDLGPADPLRRTVRRRAKLVQQPITSLNRLTALLELLGPGSNDAFSGSLATKTSELCALRQAQGTFRRAQRKRPTPRYVPLDRLRAHLERLSAQSPASRRFFDGP